MLMNNQQKGAVLIISLILLLLLTLIGASAIQTSTLEEKMAGNMRDQNIAFQSAEAGLRQGEQQVTGVLPVFTLSGNGVGSTGRYKLDGAILPDPRGFWVGLDWSNVNKVATYNGNGYIIEELPSTESDCLSTGDSLVASSAFQAVRWYRITARGVGASGNAEVIVQSIYKDCS